ncbi:MAG: glycosyl hydrolase family 28-related protein [Rikenellaceae bacterium]
MRLKIKAITLSLVVIAMAAATAASAAKREAVEHLDLKSTYVDKIDYKGLTKCAVKDYGVKSDGSAQSEAMQRALDDISAQGGGILKLPAGEYSFNGLFLRSNVHLVISGGATLHLTRPKSADGNSKKGRSIGAIFTLAASSDRNSAEYIENCSIRGERGEQYTIDYSEYNNGYSTRFVIANMVKNFMIADAKILDNYTTHCGIIFVSSYAEGADKWEIYRPTDGEIRNCAIYHADLGYGLCQLHGAERLYFEDIFSNGGMTLRMETGAGGTYGGIFDIQARNVSSHQSKASVMMSPHVYDNGTVRIDGVRAESSFAAVLIYRGCILNGRTYEPDARFGTFDAKSEIINIHAVYGEDAQVSTREIFVCEPREGIYDKFRENTFGCKRAFVVGPSGAVVFNNAEGDYSVSCRNISGEGFGEYNDKVIYVEDIMDRYKARWAIERKCAYSKLRRADGD